MLNLYRITSEIWTPVTIIQSHPGTASVNSALFEISYRIHHIWYQIRPKANSNIVASSLEEKRLELRQVLFSTTLHYFCKGNFPRLNYNKTITTKRKILANDFCLEMLTKKLFATRTLQTFQVPLHVNSTLLQTLSENFSSQKYHFQFDKPLGI